MNSLNIIKQTTSHNTSSLFNNSQISSKENHSISIHNLKDIYNKLPLKENLTINNKATIAVIRKKILNSKKFISKGIVNDNPGVKKALKFEPNKLKIEVNKRKSPKRKSILKKRKSCNECRLNNFKKHFSKKLNISNKSLEKSVNNKTETGHVPIFKFNSNKQFKKTIYQTYSNKENKESKEKMPISLKNKNTNNYIFSKIIYNKRPKNDNPKKQCQVFNLKRDSMEMEKIFYKNNDLFSNTTYNIYNVHTPIYNLINFPSSINNNISKKSLSPRCLNDLSNLSTDKNFYKKSFNLNCFLDSFENERSQMLSKDLNMTDKDFKKNLKLNNGSFSSTINHRNDKFIQTYNNIYNDRINYFKSTNGLKTTKNNNNKNINIINKMTNYNNNINRNPNNNKKNKIQMTGLKKYLTYFQSNTSLVDKKYHNKKQSISVFGKLNQNLLKDSTIIEKPKVNKKVMKINSCTLAGYTAPGIQKINQDKFFIKKDFLNVTEQFFIGICDGHGMQGHLISEYVSKNLPNHLNDTTDESIKNAYLSIQNSLQNESSKIDSSLSGTTCTSIIVLLNSVICTNVGDSRAILAKYENGAYNATNLSRDHKPTETDEMKRILSCGGRIKQFYDKKAKEYIGPERIWLKNSEIPGLAMSRSIGDSIAHSVGVIPEPEIMRFDFTGNEKFIIIASDGIWEYIDSDECIKIIKEYYENNMDAVGGLNALVKEAFKRWKIEEDNIDDITAIVLFFE